MKLMLLLLFTTTICCAGVPVKPTAYGAGLEECNRTAKTCEESIACENKLRAQQDPPRPPRPQDGCK